MNTSQYHASRYSLNKLLSKLDIKSAHPTSDHLAALVDQLQKAMFGMVGQKMTDITPGSVMTTLLETMADMEAQNQAEMSELIGELKI